MEKKQGKILAAIERVYQFHLDDLSKIAMTISSEVKRNNLTISEMFEVQEEIDAFLGFTLARLTAFHHNAELEKAFLNAKTNAETMGDMFNLLFGDDPDETDETLEDIPF